MFLYSTGTHSFLAILIMQSTFPLQSKRSGAERGEQQFFISSKLRRIVDSVSPYQFLLNVILVQFLAVLLPPFPWTILVEGTGFTVEIGAS
jgi:hypothetical protein